MGKRKAVELIVVHFHEEGTSIDSQTNFAI